MIAISSPTDGAANPGGNVTLVNSRFKSNAACLGGAGVAYIGEFSTLLVAGDANVFEANTCGGNGAVFGGMINTTITVEGGVFINNEADVVRVWVGVLHSISTLVVLSCFCDATILPGG